MFLAVFSLFLLSLVLSEPPRQAGACGVTAVVLGSTGDLARRYIWPAVFENVWTLQGFSECGFVALYAAVRKPVENEEELWSVISSNLKCSERSDLRKCSDRMTLFRNLVTFVQLDDAESYVALAASIDLTNAQSGVEEVGRIFYLAVPPFAYPVIAEKIHKHLRPLTSHCWVRVVLEKPFGHDIQSARKLSEDLLQFLKSDELYLIDHYLGKLGVQQIIPFRERNSRVLERLWNSDGIQMVEISLKERLGVEGRSRFYDQYGVICDVIQNHLTEVLVQVVLNIHTPRNGTGYLSSKNDLLSEVYPPRMESSLLGQYCAYHAHLSEDGVPYNTGNGSHTPTFAAVAVHLRDPDWIGVPFLLVSGKQLNERSAYVRIVFKRTHFSFVSSGKACEPSIVFLIQSESFSQPGVLISETIAHLSLLPPHQSWLQVEVTYEDCPYTFWHPEGDVPANAYVSLFRDVLLGNKEHFVDVTSLLRSWEIWSPLLSEMKLRQPVIHTYTPASLESLAFMLDGTKIVPSLQPHNEIFHNRAELSSSNSDNFIFGPRRINVLSGSLAQVSSKITHFMVELASETIKERGSFHMALPGGGSPLSVFQSLVLDQRHRIPWRYTHVWHTDERCVNHSNPHSNFLQLSNHLLSLVPIPSTNVHPMPVLLHSGLCVPADKGTELYERELERHARGKIDLVLLGMGRDGHIASVFPRVAVEEGIGEGVRIQQLVGSYPVHVRRRMTLSLETILEAKKIVLLVTGEGKRSVYETLLECVTADVTSAACDLPVVELAQRTRSDQLSIYHAPP